MVKGSHEKVLDDPDPWLPGGTGLERLVVVAIVGTLAVAGCISGISSEEPAPETPGTLEDASSNRTDSTTFAVEKNLTGAKAYQFTVHADQATSCDISSEVVVDQAEILLNGSFALLTVDRNDTMFLWSWRQSPTVLQAHADGQRVAATPGFEGEWTSNHTLPSFVLHGEITLTVLSEHWIRPSEAEADHSLTVFFDCEDPLPAPAPGRTAEGIVLVGDAQAKGGVGATVGQGPDVTTNVRDGRSYTASDSHVELRAGDSCFGMGQGAATIETPTSTETWQLGTDAPFQHRLRGPSGTYDWTVDFVGVSCNWWLAAWPQPAAG